MTVRYLHRLLQKYSEGRRAVRESVRRLRDKPAADGAEFGGKGLGRREGRHLFRENKRLQIFFGAQKPTKTRDERAQDKAAAGVYHYLGP